MMNEDLRTLKDLLSRFEAVCPDVDGNIDPADKKRIRKASRVILRLEFPDQSFR